jgi:glycosyltransferase involved in cell wall biosynthesis
MVDHPLHGSVRILLDYRPALRQRTGVGEYVHELVRALLAHPDSAHHALTLFSASWRDRFDPAGVQGAAVVDRRVPVRWLNYVWHQWQWPSIEWLSGINADVVHASHPIRIPSRKAAQVVTVHDLDFLAHPERTRGEVRRDYPTLAPTHVRAADAVLTVSHATAADIEARIGRPRNSITVAPLGRPDWPARREEPADGVILFFGTLEPRKNVVGLLEAYAALRARRAREGRPTPTLLIAGGPGAQAEEAHTRAAQPDLAGSVEFTGYVAPDTRPALYGRALMLVMPSFHEGFGLPALEAMTVGVPVIASAVGALPEVLGRAGTLCPAGDADALSHAMAALLDDRHRRDVMRDAGYERAAEYSWRHTADRTLAAWQLAVAHRRGRR